MVPAAPPPLPRQRKSRKWIWITAVIAVGVALVGGLAFWGMDLIAEQVGEDIRHNAVIREHIGELEDISLDFWGTSNALGMDDYVFTVRGNKGHGTLHATLETVDADTERVTAGTLEMESGRKYDLFPYGR